ncbi:GNAT family N-acetyltransferase [Rickettsiales bacterium]|nr:GNAT family N-acetyltransferase [Rickettsiales bacterium]
MIKIRNAESKDFSEIANIYKFHVENTVATFEEDAPTGDDLLKRKESYNSMPFIVASIENKIAGFAYVRPYHVRSAYRYTVEDSIYVHEDYKGRGVGKILLEKILEASKKQDIKQVIARIPIWEGGEVSISLHKKFGFEEKGCLKEVGYKSGKFIDTVLMQKTL